jgi:hydroxyethylthiazole kinase-like uncharacterized protein yjeF
MNAPTDERCTTPVFSASQVRELERLATERYGVPSYELMTRAGAAALRVLRSLWPDASAVLVYCGGGNNAGDGYVLARLAHEQGSAVRVLAVAASDRLKGDARRAYEDCVRAGVAIERFARAGTTAAAFVPDVLVDALLGIGADRPLEGELAEAVAAINSTGAPVLALDVPSGYGLAARACGARGRHRDVSRPEAGVVSRRGLRLCGARRARRARAARRGRP